MGDLLERERLREKKHCKDPHRNILGTLVNKRIFKSNR